MLRRFVCVVCVGCVVLLGDLTNPTSVQAGVRRDITTLSYAELTAYRDAFRQLQESGEFATIAGRHGCPDYYCHNDIRIFLPWHRAYIRQLEAALQAIDSNLALHYWDWTSETAISEGIPSVFTDAEYESGGMTYPNPLRTFHFDCGGTNENTTRSPDQPFLLQSLKDRVDTSYDLTSYNSFNGNGGIQGPHNSLHVWVGGDMGSTTYAAYDPIFWAHHANVDRQWAVWQECHSGTAPPPSIQVLELVPFEVNVSEVIDYRAMGYEYDNLSCSDFATFEVADGKSIEIKDLDIHPGVPQALTLEGMPAHPEKSFKVYVFADHSEATLEDIRPDNPKFVGFFGIFGGKHGDHAHHEAPNTQAQESAAGIPVLNLAPAIIRANPTAESAGGTVDLNLTILATDENGEPVDASELPFNRVSVQPRTVP